MGQYIGTSSKLEAILSGWPGLPMSMTIIFPGVLYTPTFTIDRYGMKQRILDIIALSGEPIWISCEEKRLRTTYFIGGLSEDAIIQKLEKLAILV